MTAFHLGRVSRSAFPPLGTEVQNRRPSPNGISDKDNNKLARATADGPGLSKLIADLPHFKIGHTSNIRLALQASLQRNRWSRDSAQQQDVSMVAAFEFGSSRTAIAHSSSDGAPANTFCWSIQSRSAFSWQMSRTQPSNELHCALKIHATLTTSRPQNRKRPM